jgi:predicted nucleic-acid-binding Zn-ribbon protein
VENGQCPKCDSSEVYGRRGGIASSHAIFLVLGLWKQLAIQTYVCTNCGYIENYTADKSYLPDIARNSKWNRVDS